MSQVPPPANRPPQTRRRGAKLFWAGILILIFPLAWGLWAISPDARFTVCAFRAVTGLSCPFCGLTRALGCAMRGEFAAAFRYHPLWWAAAGAILGLAVCLAADGLTGSNLAGRMGRFVSRFWAFFAAGIAVFGVWRILTCNH